MKIQRQLLLVLTVALLALEASGGVSQPTAATDSLPSFDKRLGQVKANQLAVVNAAKKNAASGIRNRVKDVRIDTEEIPGSPKFVASTRGYLIGSNGVGGAVSAATTASGNGALW